MHTFLTFALTFVSAYGIAMLNDWQKRNPATDEDREAMYVW